MIIHLSPGHAMKYGRIIIVFWLKWPFDPSDLKWPLIDLWPISEEDGLKLMHMH